MKSTIALICTCVWACATQGAEFAGTVKSIKGEAHVERGTDRIPLALGSHLFTRDKLLSGPSSSVGITLRDSTLLTAGPNASIELAQYAFDRHTRQGLLDAFVQRGTLSVVSGQIAKNNPGQMVFRTHNVTLGVRGTEFIIDVSP